MPRPAQSMHQDAIGASHEPAVVILFIWLRSVALEEKDPNGQKEERPCEVPKAEARRAQKSEGRQKEIQSRQAKKGADQEAQGSQGCKTQDVQDSKGQEDQNSEAQKDQGEQAEVACAAGCDNCGNRAGAQLGMRI